MSHNIAWLRLRPLSFLQLQSHEFEMQQHAAPTSPDTLTTRYFFFVPRFLFNDPFISRSPPALSPPYSQTKYNASRCWLLDGGLRQLHANKLAISIPRWVDRLLRPRQIMMPGSVGATNDNIANLLCLFSFYGTDLVWTVEVCVSCHRSVGIWRGGPSTCRLLPSSASHSETFFSPLGRRYR